MPTALLYDRDEVEQVEDWAGRVPRLGRRSILWVDVDERGEERARELAEAFGLTSETEARLRDAGSDPVYGDFGSYLHVTAVAPSDAEGAELVSIDCLVSEHWVVTIHDRPVTVLDEFRKRSEGSGDVGRLEGPELLANILEWVLGGYLGAIEAIELELEEFDARAMQGRFEAPEDALSTLVDFRRRIGRLRRSLVSHRPLFLALTRPELEGVTRTDHSERFAELRGQLEEVVQSARDARDSVVGSFDVLVAHTGQRTNEIMKVLTLASVLLLPGALIAGVLGMNFQLGIFEQNAYFWVVLGGIVVVAAATLVVARLRRWV